MRNILPFVLLLSGLGWGQSDSAEYPVNVHVTSSEWVAIRSSIGPLATQKLKVVIEGKKYELQAGAKGRVALLALGDYKAKLIQNAGKNSYESSQTYEFHFPDGKTRKFIVTGQTE